MHLHIPARLGIVATIAAIALTVACSDSSGPSNVDTAAQVASHFDSIYVVAAGRADTVSSAYSTRTELSTLLEIPAALGAVPSTITFTTASGTEHWKSFEFVERNEPSTDSEFVLLAYRETAAHTVLIAFFDSTGAGEIGGIVTNDTLSVNPSAANGATLLASTGSSCTTPSSALLNPQFQTGFFTSCSLATFRTSVSMTLPIPAGVDPALANLAFSTTTINGLRIQDRAASRRVNVMLRSLRARMRRM